MIRLFKNASVVERLAIVCKEEDRKIVPDFREDSSL